jgi:hypothetical protein
MANHHDYGAFRFTQTPVELWTRIFNYTIASRHIIEPIIEDSPSHALAGEFERAKLFLRLVCHSWTKISVSPL